MEPRIVWSYDGIEIDTSTIKADFLSTGTLTVATSPFNLKEYNKVTTSYTPPEIKELHNCNNCGGAVDEEGYCRYCGSRVYFFGH